MVIMNIPKKLTVITILLFLEIITLSANAQIIFIAIPVSVNIANGTENVEISLIISSDSLLLPNNLTYDAISYFQIEKTNGG